MTLGRSILVDERAVRVRGEEVADRVRGLQLLTCGDHFAQAGNRDAQVPGGLTEVLERHERQEQPLDSLLADERQQCFAVPAHRLVDQH